MTIETTLMATPLFNWTMRRHAARGAVAEQTLGESGETLRSHSRVRLGHRAALAMDADATTRHPATLTENAK